MSNWQEKRANRKIKKAFKREQKKEYKEREKNIPTVRVRISKKEEVEIEIVCSIATVLSLLFGWWLYVKVKPETLGMMVFMVVITFIASVFIEMIFWLLESSIKNKFNQKNNKA